MGRGGKKLKCDIKCGNKLSNKCDVSEAARIIVVVINTLFCAFAIMIIVLSAKIESLDPETKAGSLFEQLNVSTLRDVLIVSGFGTIITAALGVVGAHFRVRVCLLVYVVTLVVIICVQLVMGAFLVNIGDTENLGALRTKYNEDTTEGSTVRRAVMAEFQCCGFDGLYDQGLRPYCDEVLRFQDITPQTPTCGAAAVEYLADVYEPVGQAAIALGVLQLLALMGTCTIIFAAKEVREQFSVDY